jgi:hypothetical protein
MLRRVAISCLPLLTRPVLPRLNNPSPFPPTPQFLRYFPIRADCSQLKNKAATERKKEINHRKCRNKIRMTKQEIKKNQWKRKKKPNRTNLQNSTMRNSSNSTPKNH